MCLQYLQKKILTLVLAFVFAFSLSSPALAEKGLDPEGDALAAQQVAAEQQMAIQEKEESVIPSSVKDMTATASILVNAGTGEVLYGNDVDEERYPASMTKMMTCILALESGDLDRTVTISPTAADIECTRVRPGEQVKLGELVYQMMLVSDNGAAIAIGESLGGSQRRFARKMNAKARVLGMLHTHFVNPNGMPDPDHYSTAHDMARLAAYCLQNPQFRKIVSTKEKTIYYTKPADYTTDCTNTNELLWTYDGCTGLKTGYTRAAGACLAASAKRDGTELIAVVMHADDEAARFTEAAALLDYGFNYFQHGSRDE